MMFRELLQKFIVLALVVLPLAAVILAIYYTWNQYVFLSDIILLLVLYVLTALGITIGYHRMLTHTSFQASAPVRAFWIILGAMAFEGNPLRWAATHIKHHAHSDEEEDPHSPLEGFWHSHFGWLFFNSNFQEAEEYAPHLLKDPLVVWIDRLTPLWMLLSIYIPYLLGGWTGFVWGAGVRIFLVNHVTWSVNSICHTFGSRDFETTDQSRNNWLIGILAMGEGWHNNHHAFPENAYHGMRWWQFDLSGILIYWAEKLGLVWNVRSVSLDLEEAQKTRAEKMREAINELKQKLSEHINHAKVGLSTKMNSLPSVSEQTEKRLRAMHKNALKRLNTIQHFTSKNAMVKKPKMTKYIQEVQDLLANTKEFIESEVKKINA